MRLGTTELHSRWDSDNGRKHLEEAASLYEGLVGESDDPAVLVQEALMGAARARECLGDLGKAEQLYTQLRDKYPQSARGKEAAAALDRLQQPDQRQLYEQLPKLEKKGDGL
jgi:hypothetical protein